MHKATKAESHKIKNKKETPIRKFFMKKINRCIFLASSSNFANSICRWDRIFRLMYLFKICKYLAHSFKQKKKYYKRTFTFQRFFSPPPRSLCPHHKKKHSLQSIHSQVNKHNYYYTGNINSCEKRACLVINKLITWRRFSVLFFVLYFFDC